MKVARHLAAGDGAHDDHQVDVAVDGEPLDHVINRVAVELWEIGIGHEFDVHQIASTAIARSRPVVVFTRPVGQSGGRR